ncbi:tetratricopeptide repeat protein [Halalkalibacterium halodurans]|uniref:Response regulator aspartate phosphatase n=2 Tax=Halalkalibacterium halodurans TaxID=86665 RepID=Q7AJX7_HALH5|nr:Rap family tetratricopeptide repeat protein [Halalkalibacterium halodurans]MED4082711.1 tetratricopeptide repeat protein [Halalkalibacterium halodurans]MED4086637.1 tetratricopeptide repeat protein [Halalkalibacterium halodurans]MED4103213.1 tetratricopeptide repeat protein [Halalkalibacterium halodurans]MED4108922.1 tetratricopeptide repeat protein [Halalkalibacterium halodurans]MED4148659.1 tetratricopeptide repeat protein [Halalkalibacterium halodurans]
MVEKLASSEVANRLNEWYDTIKQQDVERASKLRNEVQEAINQMEEDQNVLQYFNLIDSRFRQVIEEFDKSKTILKSIKNQTERSETDQLLRYYYFFFNGLYEFYKRNYIQAIHYYRQAENFLISIPDEIEHAEFHIQLANAYYGIEQNFFSLSHAKKALNIYLNHENYVNRLITTQLTIAANELDLKQYGSAETLYKKAIKTASEHNHAFMEVLGYFNLGICYELQDKLEFARDCFEAALDISYPQENKRDSYLRIKYMLARTLFKMELVDEAMDWFEDAQTLVDATNEETYQAKLKIIYSIYKTYDETSIDNGLEVLREKKLWHDVSDLTTNAARHFKKKEMFKLATKYFSEALLAKEKIPMLHKEVESE